MNTRIAKPWQYLFSKKQRIYFSTHINEEQEDDIHEDDATPWRNLLYHPARAKWRTTPSYSTNYIESEHSSLPKTIKTLLLEQRYIIQKSQRTKKQLYRSHQKMIEQENIIRQHRHQSRMNIQPSNSVSLGYKPEQTCVYLHHRLLPNFHIMERIFYEIQSLTKSNPISIQKVLDFGIGCGSASAAALHVFDTIQWIHGVDASQSMREVSSHILNNLAQDSFRVTFSESLSNNVKPSGTFDLALFAYTANEIPSHAAILTTAAILWEKLAPNGVFVMVEPGTPDGFQSVRAVRQMLLECCPDTTQEHAHIIAPCTHNGSCPMNPTQIHDYDDTNPTISRDNLEETNVFSESFCSFVHALPSHDFSRSKWTKKRGEKFSYIVIQKRIDSPSYPTNINLVDLLAQTIDSSSSLHEKFKQIQKNKHVTVTNEEKIKHESLFQKALEMEQYQKDLELVQPSKHSQNNIPWGRLVRAPLKKRGHVYVDFCTGGDHSQGRILRHKVTKGKSTILAPGLFSAARKARWGGLWPDLSINNQNKNDSYSKTFLKELKVVMNDKDP